jgi:hypothetical protein
MIEWLLMSPMQRFRLLWCGLYTLGDGLCKWNHFLDRQREMGLLDDQGCVNHLVEGSQWRDEGGYERTLETPQSIEGENERN